MTIIFSDSVDVFKIDGCLFDSQAMILICMEIK